MKKGLAILVLISCMASPLAAESAEENPPQPDSPAPLVSPPPLTAEESQPNPSAEAPLAVPPPLTAATAPALTQPESAGQLPGDTEEAARAWAAGDVARARQIWETLANAGDAQAMNNLGVIYDQGTGLDPDIGRALYWFAMAANNGNAAGMNNYGRLLEQGRGIAENPAEAARWFDAAARLGQPEAQFNIGFLYEHGRGVPQNDQAAAAWYSRAASMRQREALARLGHFYHVGRGVEQNSARATLLLYGAAMDGSEQAIKELEEMSREQAPKAEAILFGQKLDQSTRTSMREALEKAGATATRVEDGHICDEYDVSKIAPGASMMAICYGPNDRLGFLKTDYPAQDRTRADAVIKMVEDRFGAPSAGEGEDSRLWNLGPVIVATQYAPTHGQISLMYMVPEVYHQTRNDSSSQ